MACDLTELWERYKKNNDPLAKDQLIEHYLPFVRGIASSIIRKLKAGVELDDLVNDGVFGLIRAVELFELERGLKFETYATSVVRGAIFNGIRAMDWVPERTREKTRALQRAMDNFTASHGRLAQEEELAKELKISASEVYNLIVDMGCMYLLSLEQPLSSDGDDEGVVMDTIENKHSYNPLIEVEFEEQRRNLLRAIEELEERDRLIVKMHYFDEMSFDKISQIIGISKQRISQLHARIIKHLRKAISLQGLVCIAPQENTPIVDTKA